MPPRSTHVEVGGTPDRALSAAKIHSILDNDPVYLAAVQRLAALDVLSDEHWPDPCACTGFGTDTLGRQDGKRGALLSNQLISAEIEEIEAHIERARQLQHPACAEHTSYKADSQHATRTCAELRAAVSFSADNRAVWESVLSNRLRILEEVSASLEPLTERLRSELSPPHIKCTPFEHAHIALMAAMTRAVESQDIDLPVRLTLGALVSGDLPPTRAWDAGFTARSLGIGFDDLRHNKWNEWLARDIERRAKRSSDEDNRALWERTIEELDKGLCDGPWEAEDLDAMYGVEYWRAIRRFGVWQNGKLRACDDAKESLHNAAATVHDKMRTQSADFPARVADLFAQKIGRGTRGWSLVHGTDDLDAAYRRILTATPGYTVAAVFNPEKGRTQFFTLPGFNFGLVSAVNYFNAVPELTASATRRLLGIPTDHYFDDFDVTTLAELGKSSQSALGRLHELCGFPFSVKKHKPCAPKNKFLGVVSDFRRLASTGTVILRVDTERKSKLIAGIVEVLRKGCPPSVASKLAGKLQFTLAWSFGRVGRAALQPILVRSQEEGSSGELTPGMKRALLFLRDVVESLPPCEVSLDRVQEEPVLIWSDAMWEPKSACPAQGGFVVRIPAVGDAPPKTYYSSHETPKKVIDWFVPGKKQYIGQLELLYAVAAYTSVPTELEGRRVIHFIDNTSAVAGLVKGYSSAIDSGRIVNAFHAFNAGLRAETFFEYVRSKANMADLPSRGESKRLLRILRKAGCFGTIRRVECKLPDLAQWHDHASVWMGRGRSAAGAKRAHQSSVAARKRRRTER